MKAKKRRSSQSSATSGNASAPHDQSQGADSQTSSAGSLASAVGDGLRARLQRPFSVGFFLTLGGLAAFVLGAAISSLSTVLIYIAFALFAALGLDPVVAWLERHKVPRAWGTLIVIVAFALVLAGVLMLVIPTVVRQISQFVADIPSLVNNFQQSDVYAWLIATFGDRISTITEDVQNFLTDPSNIAAIGGGVLQVGSTIATGISGVVIVIVLVLYFIATLPAMKQNFYRLVPARNRPVVADLTDQITASVGGYVMGMVVLAFVNSVVVLVLHLVLGLPFPQLMAVAAFLITLIPLIGSLVFWVAGTGIALFTGLWPAIIFAIAYLVYMQIEAYVLTPRIMNRAVSVPGSLVVIGALVGGTLLGLLGALIAIPVTASILLILKQVLIPQQDAKT